VERYRSRLLRVCTHFLGWQDADCEDLVQETFLQALAHLAQWQPDRELYSWLNKICVNLCFKALRRRRREQLMEFEGLESAGRAVVSERQQLAEQADARSLAMERVRAALDGLDVKCRRIVSLRDLEGMSYSDIALTLRLAPGTVFSRLARCRQALKKLVLEGVRGGRP